MALSTNDLKPGTKVLFDGDPYSILENEYVKPGKGQAFNRLRIRNLKTGRVIEKTLRSAETVDEADIAEMDMQYLYNDGEFWHFMDPNNYEQLTADKTKVGDAAQWLKEQDSVKVLLWNGVPLQVTPPNTITVKVVETDPGLRGNTVQGGTKPAKVETGATVKVPLFIVEGEMIMVDTRTGEYLNRAGK
ncbi:MAG TPA: elongation factor P [Candidatus Binatia bacterium]|nr:elongation factor P [Candidatus Binatia bacterium]